MGARQQRRFAQTKDLFSNFSDELNRGCDFIYKHGAIVLLSADNNALSGCETSSSASIHSVSQQRRINLPWHNCPVWTSYRRQQSDRHNPPILDDGRKHDRRNNSGCTLSICKNMPLCYEHPPSMTVMLKMAQGLCDDGDADGRWNTSIYIACAFLSYASKLSCFPRHSDIHNGGDSS